MNESLRYDAEEELRERQVNYEQHGARYELVKNGLFKIFPIISDCFLINSWLDFAFWFVTLNNISPKKLSNILFQSWQGEICSQFLRSVQ